MLGARPPSETPRFPVTGLLMMGAVAVTLGYWTGGDIDRLVVTPRAFDGQPWRLLTAALPHGDPSHLGFNLLWTWIFGALIEGRYGSLKFLALVLVTAVGSSAAEYALFHGGIGLSGIGYGLFGFLWALERHHPQPPHALDRGTVWAFIIWFFLCIVLTALDIWPIGNAAHGAGLVLGYGAGLAASHTGGAQAAWAGAMAGLLVLTLVAAADLRDAVTLRPKAEVAFEMGTYALDEGELPKAIALLTRAVTLAPDYADAQYNLGVAYQRADQLHAAAAALAQAHELDPENTLFAQHGAWAYSYLAWEAGSRQDHPAAVALYRRALALDPSSPDDWLNLGLNLLGTGDEEAAESAIQQAHELAPDRGDINDHLAQRRLVTALQAFQAGDLATARGLLEEAAALPLQSEEIRRQVTELLTQIRARTPATPSVAP